ncbi:MAG: Rossmann-like and DUF2520 domain-containing protein [Prevotella sp.]
MVGCIVLVGAGNVATHIGLALVRGGFHVAQVYSRTEQSAARLAGVLGCAAVTRTDLLATDADAYIISVKDDALPDLLPGVCARNPQATFLHTAGSVSLDVFRGYAEHAAVLYPMQTFSRERPLDFREIPCFVEWTDKQSERAVMALATALTDVVHVLSSDRRRYLHLAAVFACNFANHCYAIAADVLERAGLPFDVMLPLVDETARKVHALPPREAQTGPAVRYDQGVMDRHLALLGGEEGWKDIYRLMSESIHKECVQKARNKQHD